MMKRNFRKNLLLVLFTMPLLFAFQCDEEFMPDEEVKNLGLINVKDDKKTFSVGESIFINTVISNQQTTIGGKTIDLKDYLNGGQLLPFYSLGLYKVSSSGEREPYFIENTQEIEGTIRFDDENHFFDITTIYDEANATFSSNIGIKLLEKGNYILDTRKSRDNFNIVTFKLRSILGVLVLTTSIAGSNDEGLYTFTVE